MTIETQKIPNQTHLYKNILLSKKCYYLFDNFIPALGFNDRNRRKILKINNQLIMKCVHINTIVTSFISLDA
jgi:hypothetical protein